MAQIELSSSTMKKKKKRQRKKKQKKEKAERCLVEVAIDYNSPVTDCLTTSFAWRNRGKRLIAPRSKKNAVGHMGHGVLYSGSTKLGIQNVTGKALRPYRPPGCHGCTKCLGPASPPGGPVRPPAWQHAARLISCSRRSPLEVSNIPSSRVTLG